MLSVWIHKFVADEPLGRNKKRQDLTRVLSRSRPRPTHLKKDDCATIQVKFAAGFGSRFTASIMAAVSTQLTLNLPDEVVQRATQYAEYAKRDVKEIITATLASTLPSLDMIQQLRAIATLPDREVLALTELRMKLEADRRLSKLLDRQQAGELDEIQRAELAALMRSYEVGILRQSEALAEAVRRGLLPTLEP